MYVVIDKEKRGWNFTLKQGETVIYSSMFPHPFFYGKYSSTYNSPEAAFGACRMFMFRNASIMDKIEGKETMNEVQQSIVDGMLYRLNSFIFRLRDIRHDEGNEKENSLQKTVPSLEKLLSDSISTINYLVSEIEIDTSEEAILDSKQEYSSENVKNEASVYLLRITEKMKKMRNKLKNDFSHILKTRGLPEGPTPKPMEPTGSFQGLKKYASLMEDDPDIFANLLADHVDSVKDSLGGGYVRNIEKTSNDGWVFLIKTQKGEYGVRIGDDALFRGIFPSSKTSSKYPYMSLAFWNDILKPAMASVGHWMDCDSGYLILPKTVAISTDASDDGSRIADVLKSFDTKTNEKCACEIVSKRGKRTKGDLCFARRCVKTTVTANTLEDRVRSLKNATMAKIIAPQSKYHGIAGPMDPERMKIRNDYIEVPVRIKFDTGLDTEIWMADDEIEVYMEGGDGTPQEID